MKAADSVNVPDTLLGCFAVLQNDDILCPADGCGFHHSFRHIFIRPVKLPHPAQIPWGETRNIRIGFAQVFGGGDSGAFLRPGVDELADFPVRFHLRQVCQHQSIQRCKHGAVIYRFPDVHGLLLSGAVRLFSLSTNVDSSMVPRARSTELSVFWEDAFSNGLYPVMNTGF